MKIHYDVKFEKKKKLFLLYLNRKFFDFNRNIHFSNVMLTGFFRSFWNTNTCCLQEGRFFLWGGGTFDFDKIFFKEGITSSSSNILTLP